MSDVALPVLWLSGPSGVGKSSVGWEVFARLSRDGVRTAFVDGDQISLCHPEPEIGTHRVRARSLAAMVANLRAEGVRCLVFSSFVDTLDEVAEYTKLMPDVAFTLCRLRVGGDELRRRFLARGWRPDLVEEAVAEAEGLEASVYADVRVDTDGLTVAEAAHLVRERAGWPGMLPSGTPRTAPVVAEAGDAPVWWFAGATASGKSTVAYAVFTEILRTGVRAAYLDVKQIGALRPATGGGTRLKARNLAALWAGFREDGAECLIVSGEADDARGHAGLPLTVFRLHAGPATLADRVARRGRGEGPALPGDELRGLDDAALRDVAARAAREAAALERTGAGDVRVDTDGLSVQEVTAAVRAHMTSLERARPA